MSPASRTDAETTPPGREPGDSDLTRTYVRVIVIWLGVLAALYAFSQYFG